eukprot:TRINITY_DN20304_c0_g1_i2.p1 TRINITY_DN20304_c0_g1~~TRINITY_DN20304_c0_g1_i2.p1  ORF type:complete len:285 (+),score=37.50 TRINITY_DN20304_c0_g1_i2:53-856(+)
MPLGGNIIFPEFPSTATALGNESTLEAAPSEPGSPGYSQPSPSQTESSQTRSDEPALRRPLSRGRFQAKVQEKTCAAVKKYVRSRSLTMNAPQSSLKDKIQERKCYQQESERRQRDILRSIQDSVLERPLLMDDQSFVDERRLQRRARSHATLSSTASQPPSRANLPEWFVQSQWAQSLVDMQKKLDQRTPLHKLCYPPKIEVKDEPKRSQLLENIEADLMEKVRVRREEMAENERKQWDELRRLRERGRAKSPLLALRLSRPASAF